MPFLTAYAGFWFGTATYAETPPTYCQHNTSASDYGKCYGIIGGKAVFVQTDRDRYPTLPCETDDTCIRYTSTTWSRTLATLFNYPGKQAVLQYFNMRSHSNAAIIGKVMHFYGLPVPVPPGMNSAYLWFMPSPNYELASWPVYDPVTNYKAYLDPYRIPVGRVSILRWQGNVFTTSAVLQVYEGNVNNLWYAFDGVVVWAYEASPLAIIPLDYDSEYLPYEELRDVFGYSVNGVDQPGWNAGDIIRVLKELFPDRAWAVYDDGEYILYLYNLTPDYVPDWLVKRLAPLKIKVLKRPSDIEAARRWLEELNRRNGYNYLPQVSHEQEV
jgi:hypothetical protein